MRVKGRQFAQVAATSMAMLAAGFSWSPTTSLAQPSGHAARTVYVSEHAHLHLVSARGTSISDKGTATGTYKCTLVIHFKITSASTGVATFTAYPHGGSISGRANASYSVSGTSGHFLGTMTITSGTGTFVHAHGRGLLIKGTINRFNYGVTAQLSGPVSL